MKKYLMLLIGMIVFASTMATAQLTSQVTLVETMLNEKPSASDVTYIAYFNGTDNYILTEDSYSGGYDILGDNGYCTVQTTKIAQKIDVAPTSSFEIWVSTDKKAGHSTLLQIFNMNPATAPDITLSSDNFIPAPVIDEPLSQKSPAPGLIDLYFTKPVPANTEYRIYRTIQGEITDHIYEFKGTIASGNVYHDVVTPGDGYWYLAVAVSGAKRSGHSDSINLSSAPGQEPVLQNITLSADNLKISAGTTVNLTVTAYYDNNGKAFDNITTGSSTWSIDGISNTGAYKPTKIGTYPITATFGGKQSEITITVTPAALKDYTVLLDPANPVAGQTVNISIKDNVGIDEFGNDVAISSYSPTSWKKDQAGTYNIDVMADEIPKPVPVTVVHDITSDIIVTPASALVELGDKLTITAKGIDQLGNETGTASTSYTATKLGDNTVTMTIDTISKDAIVKVIPKIESILISDNNAIITNDLTLNIKAKDKDGKEVELSLYGLAYVFENADNGVFSVAGKEDGAYTVKATLNTKSPLTAEAIINLNINAPVITVKNDLNETIDPGAILPSLPKLSISVEDASGINTDVKIFIDGVPVKASEIQASSASISGVKSYTVAYAAAEKLSVGTHTLKITAQDIHGKPAELTISGLKVYAGVSVVGTPLNFPNPVKPSIDLKTTIKYTLANDADVKIIILDVTGRQVYTQLCAAGSEGGRIGINKVEYDCKDTAGNVLGNGVYHYLLINEGQVIGRGQIAVLD